MSEAQKEAAVQTPAMLIEERKSLHIRLGEIDKQLREAAKQHLRTLGMTEDDLRIAYWDGDRLAFPRGYDESQGGAGHGQIMSITNEKIATLLKDPAIRDHSFTSTERDRFADVLSFDFSKLKVAGTEDTKTAQ